MSDWKEIHFSDFVAINPPVKLPMKEQVSFVEMKDLEDGRRYCYPSSTRLNGGGAKFENGDTLFARITPCLENGKICQVSNLKNGKGLGSTEFLVFRGKPEVSDADFVFYLSRWSEVRSHAELNLVGTSGRQRVPKECFNELMLNLPDSINEQKAIASILSSLDDKIDLLHRQNTTLEKMAETLFRQWFVEEAKEEWENAKIGDFVVTNKKSITKDYPYEEIQYLDTSTLNAGMMGNLQILNVKEAPSRARRLTKHNDILISTVRPDQKHYGIVKNPPNNLVVSTGFCVITCEKIGPHFIYFLLTNNEMTEYLHSIAEGSTSTYPSLKPSDIEKIEFLLPAWDKLNIFEDIVSKYFEKIKANQSQILTLTTLRDTLLPKLMSGEVKVETL